MNWWFNHIKKVAPEGSKMSESRRALKKAPFDIPQQQEQTVETAKTEFITWLEENVDEPLKEEIDLNPNPPDGYYEIRLPAPNGSIMKIYNMLLESIGGAFEIMKKEYDLKDVTIYIHDDTSLRLALYPN